MRKVVAIVGPIGSGKDTAAEYLSRKLNWQAYKISDILRSISKERNLSEDRQSLIKLNFSLAQEFGNDYLGKRLLSDTTGNIIVTGIRVPAVIDFLRNNTNFFMIGIDAKTNIRYKRAFERGVAGDIVSYEEFTRNEKIENSPPNPQRVFQLVDDSDFHFMNNDSLAVLHAFCDGCVNKIANHFHD